MASLLSQKELVSALSDLRSRLLNYDYDHLSNVIFFNIDAVYRFFYSFEGVNALMQKLEPYIPFPLTEKSLYFYIDASFAQEEDTQYFEQKFNSHAKVDFINIVRCASTADDWNHIIALCENLRRNLVCRS